MELKHRNAGKNDICTTINEIEAPLKPSEPCDILGSALKRKKGRESSFWKAKQHIKKHKQI